MAPSKVRNSVESGATANLKKVESKTDPKWSAYRRLVLLVDTDGYTYLNASSSPPGNLIVHDALTRFSNESLHNPNPKPQWQQIATETRELITRYINAPTVESIAFVRDTTEGLGCFIHGLKFKPGDNVVSLLDSEHPNHAYGWMALREAGLEVRQIPTVEKTGLVVGVDANTFAPYVDDRTRAIGISSVMFHSGQRNNIEEICATFRPKGIHVLADLTQQVGFSPVDVQTMGVSAAAFSFHKGLNCPTGIAALYVDPVVIEREDPTPPMVGYGAVHNVRSDLLVPADPIVYHPNARRYEHLNCSLIAATAAKAFLKFYLDEMGPQAVEDHLFSLGDALREHCQDLGIETFGPTSRDQHAAHLCILNLHGEQWSEHLRSNDILTTAYRLGIRVSFGFYNNLEDVSKLAKALRAGLEKGFTAGNT